MKILVINPNTSTEMTKDIEKTIAKVKNNEDETIVTMPDFGPRSLESFYDYSLATFGSIREINKHKNVDGILIACFGDPGIYPLKEKYDCPIIGIAEASMSMALLIGKKFSLLVASEKAVPMMEDMVKQYGLSERLSSVETIGINVLDIEKYRRESVKQLASVGEEAIKKGGEILILGCAGMTSLKVEVEDMLGVPIIDPVSTGYKLLKSMLDLKLNISKVGFYKEPYPQEILNEKYLK